MRTVKPALALVEYSGDKKSVRGLTPVALDDCCEPRCDLESPDEWIIYNHIRADEEKYPRAKETFVQLVLMLESGQDAGAYQISVLSVEDGTNTGMTPYCAPDGTWYFVPPWANDNVKRAGRQEILIEYAGEPEERRTVRVYILPSAAGYENYKLMLEEIARLHQKLLVTSQSAGTVSVGERWENVARDLERDTEQMRHILRQLETAPDQDLVAVQSRVPGYKVKKLTAKTVVDQAAGRRLVRTSLHAESLDIYEHRMIRAHLEKLKGQVLRYQEMEAQERSGLAGEEISRKELEAAHRRLNEKLRQMREPVPASSGSCRELQLRVEGVPNINSSGFIGCFASKDPGDTKSSKVLFDTDGTRMEDMGWFNGLALCPGYSIWQYWFLYHCINELTQFWKNSDHRSGVLVNFWMAYTPTPIEKSPKGDKRYKIVIDYLDSMTLPGCPPVRFHEFAGRFRSIREESGLIQCIRKGELPDPRDEDNLFYSASLVGLAARRDSLLRGQCGWDGIKQQIDQLLTSPVLRSRPHKSERLHASNLFANHRLYRRAYVLMQKRQEQLSAIDLWTGRSIPAGTTHSVYEIWCLLKMLSIWVHDYSFTLDSPSIRVLTDQLRRRSDRDAVGPIKLVKKSGKLKGMVLELEYNQTFYYMKKGKQKNLRPDYCLTICYGGKTYRFFMDAKFHNFSKEQMGIEAWYENLYDVALNKYIFTLGDTRLRDTGAEVKTCGSYILHPDAEHRPKSGWDPKKYFWYRSDLKGSKEDPESAKVLNNKFPDLLESGDENKDGSKVESLRFGSVCFTPLSDDSRTDAYFRILMQMIMEHFLGKDTNSPDTYREKCWICGSEDVDCTLKYTAGGKEKYHIMCKNCNQFWVRTICVKCGRPLGKHLNNYYRIRPGTSWNVICPNCEAGLEQDPKA